MRSVSLWHAHETTAETAMIAGLAAAYYGVAISHRKPYKGALAFGAGSGVAFLAKGLVAVAQPLAAALLVLTVSAAYRQRSFALAVGLGLVILAPFVLVWPALLAANAPDYFAGWVGWQLGNISHPPALADVADVLRTFAWALFPVWPMTLWATWGYRRRLREPGFAVPFAASIVSFVLLFLMRNPRDIDMLALLVPLSIPAGVAAIALRRGAANALAWFAMMTFTLAAGYMWLMWIVTLAGVPERLARTAARLEPGFKLEVEWQPLAFAVLLTIGVVRPDPARGALDAAEPDALGGGDDPDLGARDHALARVDRLRQVLPAGRREPPQGAPRGRHAASRAAASARRSARCSTTTPAW